MVRTATVEPKKRKIVITPGQGFHKKDMGKRMCREHKAAAVIYEMTSDICKISKEQLWMEPGSPLTPQSSLIGSVVYPCAQLAVRRELEEQDGLTPKLGSIEEDEELYWAGFSSGMYPGLHASGILSNYEELMQILNDRSECLDQVSVGTPCMMKITGNTAGLEGIFKEAGVDLALEHLPDIIMVGGYPHKIMKVHKTIIDMNREDIIAEPNEKVMRPFHTYLYRAVAKIFANKLKKRQFQAPTLGRVISNVTGDPLPPEGQLVKKDLTRHLYSPVRFGKTLLKWGLNLRPHPYADRGYIRNPVPVETTVFILGPGGSYFVKLMKRFEYIAHRIAVVDLSDERKIGNTKVRYVGVY